MKKANGITLVALVVTIIVILVLAGVGVKALTGENGLLNKTVTAMNEYKKRKRNRRLKIMVDK